MSDIVSTMSQELEAARCVYREPAEIPGGAPKRCTNYSEEGSLLCAHHASSRIDRTAVLASAQNKMLSMADRATSVFGDLMEDPDPNVRFKAAEAVLNYSGLSKGAVVSVEIRHEENTADTLMSKLNDMVRNAAESKAVQDDYFSRHAGFGDEDTIDAEVVEEEE